MRPLEQLPHLDGSPQLIDLTFFFWCNVAKIILFSFFASASTICTCPLAAPSANQPNFINISP